VAIARFSVLVLIVVDSVAVIDSPDIRSLRELGFSNNATPSGLEL
jgi:hypothetical protein